jgi:polyisoprenoid-binding protein YceI
MSTRAFQWTVIGLLIAVIGMLGIVAGLIWNQQVDRERPLVVDGSSQRALTGGGEERAPSPDSKSEQDTQPPQADSPAPETLANADAEEVEEPGTYRVDAETSRIYVKVGSATRLGHPHGVEGRLKTGKIQLGSGGELVFDMSSFKADTAEARKKVGLEGKKVSESDARKTNANMLAADVLDVEKFPTATYKIVAIKPVEEQNAGAPGLYEVEGRFTLHGAEKPLKVKAKLERTDREGVLKLSGSFAIKQTDYGITPYSAVGGLVKVADALEITGELLLSPAK